MRCSVAFGVTLRLLVINISSSSPAINTATYHQRCVITCDMLAVVHRRPRLQHLACCSVTKGSEARLRIAISAYPTCIQRGFPSQYCHAVLQGKTRMAWLPDGEKCLMIYFFVLTQLTNVTDRQTDTNTHTHRQTDTAWRHRQRLCKASHGRNTIWLLRTIEMTH